MSNENPIIRLRPELGFTTSLSSCGTQFVAEDRVNQKFWRLGLLEYEVCAVLEDKARMKDILAQARLHSRIIAEHEPEKVHKTILWLLQAGILEIFPDHGSDHPSEPAQANGPPKLFDPSFFRITLIRGEALERLIRPLRWMISYPVALVAAMLWIVGIIFAVANASQLARMSGSLFLAGSQWWLLLAWIILKFVHELGHAVTCARVGAKATSAGLGFMFFTPSPFVNVTNVWRIDNRWSRILVGAGGMLFEWTLASVAVVGACWFEAASMRYLCISIVTLGTISTIVFNANPLMRFDGYYILIDVLGRPNLWQDAQAATKNLVRKLLYRTKSPFPITPILLSYGLTSLLYRTLTLLTLAWGLWVAWDGFGIIVVLSFCLLWFVLPQVFSQLYRRTASLSASHWSIVTDLCWKKCSRVALVAVSCFLLGFLPSPVQIYWPGTIDFVEPVELRASSPGFVSEVIMHDGQGVRKGDEIIKLCNPDLEFECEIARSMMVSSEEKCHSLRAQHREAELQAEEANLHALQFQYASLQQKLDALTLRAPRDGVLMIRFSSNLPGTFLSEGTSIGLVVDPSKLEVKASIPQDEWDKLSRSIGAETEITLSNGEMWLGEMHQVLPRSTDELDYPSMSGSYGGPLTVVPNKSADGKEEFRSEKPRLQARIGLKANSFQRSLWTREYRPSPPTPGILCTVKFTAEDETIWQTARRWYYAAIRVQFKDIPQEG